MPLEEVFLNEFAKLFPKRYAITNGVVSDTFGHTAGDCDAIIFNDFWFPYVISGATNQSRRKFLPIDGIYAIGEIKSTLTERTLDEACKKLITCSRLNRHHTHNNRLIENRENGCFHGITNPLYTFIITTGIDSNTSFESLIDRFYDINRQVKRLEVIRCLCVLGKGVVVWAFDDDDNMTRPAIFMNEDLYKPIFPFYIPYDEKISSLYHLTTSLHLHLFHSVLAPEDFALYYGSDQFGSKKPTSLEISLKPDLEWLDKLSIKCKNFDH